MTDSPTRPRLVVEAVSPRLAEILAAMEGMSDEEAAAYWDRVYPPRDLASYDRDLAGPCATCWVPLCVRCEQPGPELIDRAVALARTGSRPTLREIADE